MMLRHLKALVIRAQELHDGSWSKRRKRHILTQTEAAELACKEAGRPVQWATPIMLLNTTAWNDVQMWAQGKK